MIGGGTLGAGMSTLMEGFQKMPKKNQNSPTNVDRMLVDWLRNNREAPQYQGPTTVQAPALEGQLQNLLSGRLSGQGLGMSDQEQQTYMNQIQNRLNERREKGVTNTLRQMNQRGILNSTITGENVGEVEGQYADSLANAQFNMYLQNEQMKRNALNNAISQALGLGQMQTSRETGNINRALQNFYQQQQLNQLPFQNMLQYMSGVQLPREDMDLRKWIADREAEAKESAGQSSFWGDLLGGFASASPFI